MKIRKVSFLVKGIIIFILLIFTIIPLVNADLTVINEQGEQSATINIQPYQIGNNNYADILIQGINNYIGDEIFIKRVSYSLQILTGDIGLGRYSETIYEPFICLKGDLACELEKQNREQITIYSETDLFAFPNLSFDYATLKLKMYKDINNIVSCSDFDVNTFECNSDFEKQNVSFLSDNLFVYLNLTHFSGWVGTSYFYADMEQPGVNLCLENGDYYKGSCDGDNKAITNYTDNVFMDNEAMRVSTYTGSNRAYGFVPLESPSTGKHYSRIYMYISKEDLEGLILDSPLFSVMDASGNTTACGFMFNNSKEEISCIYDETFDSYNPTEFGTKINITEYGLWDKWFTLEYFIDVIVAGTTGVNNCTCWVNGTSIASIGNLNYDERIKSVVVGYPISRDNGAINLTFDEHRIANKYIGGYPDIITTYVKYNLISPLIDQTIYANITDNEGVDDISYVYLEFNYIFNISMYRLDSTNTWEVNISYSNFTAGNNYTYTVYANDSNGQNAIPFTSSFLTNYNDIIFNSSFESGNLYNVTYINGTANGERFYEAYINYSTEGSSSHFWRYHWWFYFKVSNTANKNLHINITNVSSYDFIDQRWQNLRPRYSYDNNTNTIYSNWSLVPYDTVSYGNATYPWFHWNLTITQDHAWFASTPPYTVSMLNEFIEEIKDSPFINYTNLTVSPHGRNVTIIDVTNFTVDSDKDRVYIIAQQHANEEPQGSWASMGAIRFLINETNETAEAIRNSSIFRFMPILNVDGVYEGRGRFTPVYPETTQYDTNREWDNAYDDDPHTYPIVNVTFWDVNKSFEADIFLDWHGSINGEAGLGIPDDLNYYLLEEGWPAVPLPETRRFLEDYITPVWWRYVYENYIYQSGDETAPPNIWGRWDITPAATFEWTINKYASTNIVANSTIWLEDGHNIMLGIYNYFESL